MRSQTFFKEIASGFAKKHGVWPHAIQWFAIITHFNKTGFLFNLPLDIYRELGRTVGATVDDAIFWNSICDVFDEPTYSSPEFITRRLSDTSDTGSPLRWPLLHGTVVRSKEKNFRTESSLLRKYGSSHETGIVRVKEDNIVKLKT